MHGPKPRSYAFQLNKKVRRNMLSLPAYLKVFDSCGQFGRAAHNSDSVDVFVLCLLLHSLAALMHTHVHTGQRVPVTEL